jgi:hypothetical protein
MVATIMAARNRCVFILACALCLNGLATDARPAESDDIKPSELGQTSTQIDGQIYGARRDATGPLGGGSGYQHMVSEGDFVVKNLEELIQAMQQAESGQVVLIPGDTEIDLTTFIYIEQFVLEIPAGVTLAGQRGQAGLLGALLSSDALETRVMIRAAGPDVRVTGLRLRGPNPKRYLDHHRRAFGPGGDGHEYYYKFPIQDGISTSHDGLIVDNCDISGFGHAGVCLRQGKNHHIHHNFIHLCQYNGLGYGVSHNLASSTIEFNLFNENRHSIAGTGRPGCTYVARHNVELGISLSHCFDMHGGRDREDGTNVAGSSIEIYNNTFRAPRTPVVIRGVPEEACRVHHNWFLHHTTPEKAVRAAERTEVFDNAYGHEPPSPK